MVFTKDVSRGSHSRVIQNIPYGLIFSCQTISAGQPTNRRIINPIVSRLDAENRCPLEALIIRDY